MAKIEGLVKEVVILRDSKDILIEISESLSSLLVENKEVLISGHSINIKDVSKNRFKVNLTTEMLSSTYLDEIIYGSKIAINLGSEWINKKCRAIYSRRCRPWIVSSN